MQNFINRCLANGDTPSRVHELESIIIPSIPFRSLEEGCVIRISHENPMVQTIPHTQGEGQLRYLIVEVVFPDGEKTYDKLFLGTIVKAVRPIDSTKWVCSHGTFVDFVRSFFTWGQALPHIFGKTILVTDVVEVETRGFNDRVRTTHVYGFDLLKD